LHSVPYYQTDFHINLINKSLIAVSVLEKEQAAFFIAIKMIALLIGAVKYKEKVR